MEQMNKVEFIGEKNVYSTEMLFNDLLNEGRSDVSSNQIEIEELREYRYLRKLLQAIVNSEISSLFIDVENDNLNNLNEIKKTIENIVEENDVLYGYTFYVSSNHTFNYSWSYLRKQICEYVDFLFNANRFFTFIIRDINTLANVFAGHKDIHIVFNEIIDVAFYDVVPYVRASMRWSNFQMITKVKDGYQIKIMCEENTWAVFDRLYKESVELLSKKASKQIELRQTRK